MFLKHLLPVAVLSFFVVQFVTCGILEHLFKEAASCQMQCEQNFSESSPIMRKACTEGCRLVTIITIAKNIHDHNQTMKLCETACYQGFINETISNACMYGCSAYPLKDKKEEEEPQTLHLLTPLMYVRSAYNTMAHHVKQFISTSWTVYVQEDSGKMVVLQTSPKVVESLEYSVSRDDPNNLKDYQQGGWQEAKLDWMDCISHQSGIPRWLLVVVLFGFIFALLWLCCATAVTAPNHYLSSKKKDLGYILVCEPNNEMKAPIVPLIDVNEEAPPLPPKVSLI